MKKILKTAEEWLKTEEFCKYTILDPDGWDRRGDKWEASWNEKIDRNEFRGRLMMSTVCRKK